MACVHAVAKALPVVALTAFLGGCTAIALPDPGSTELKGTVLVEWNREDAFIYRATSDPVSFRPSFLAEPIVPESMYTDGGSVPRVFWSVAGLSPWGLGPAYILHDWIFEVHRCANRDAPAAVKNLTFEQSAQVLAEVGQALVGAGLIDHDLLPAIVWAVRTRYARSLWDKPGTPDNCRIPKDLEVKARTGRPFETVVRFKIPEPR